ncbi:MAG: transcription termination/antitermination protein NusA [Firmicutes bacterium]|nr:transcription termination/antitermination protein NusA [Candidatus Fiminaster equi]
MDATKFIEALDELEAAKGISKESIIAALEEALHKALEKQISDGYRNDGDIRVKITEDPAEIDMCYVRKVVEEVEDDYLEISVEEANKGLKKAKYAVGDEFVVKSSPDDMLRLTALTVKSVLRQKLAEAEKQSLYELYKDKIGEMITGIVEKCDDRGAVVNIGRSSLYLTRRDLIGDEMLEMGAPVRLYVSDVTGAEAGKAPMVRVSRADAGFLKRLFEEEVREIYDGTVIIKSIAREAGVRSKLAVYSNDPNVDSVGCCIGMNGSAIQKIVAQLGNSKDKEKIDIIQYSPNDALFIIDALRPATVIKIGVEVDENGKKNAVAVVPDGQLSLAIGRKGANVRVASKLTDTHIDIKEESMADEVEMELKSVETIQEEEKIRIQKEKYEKYLSQVKSQRAEAIKTEAGLEKAKPQKIVDEVEPVVETKPVEQPKVEAPVEAPVMEEEKPVAKPTVVRTTTSIDALEAALESDKKKESFKATQKTSKRPRKIEENEVAHEEVKVEETKPQMAIYTDEELAELEKEEEFYEDDYEDSDEDIDYDEFDEYYDDDDK